MTFAPSSYYVVRVSLRVRAIGKWRYLTELGETGDGVHTYIIQSKRSGSEGLSSRYCLVVFGTAVRACRPAAETDE